LQTVPRLSPQLFLAETTSDSRYSPLIQEHKRFVDLVD
jgi:hypothetical protein